MDVREFSDTTLIDDCIIESPYTNTQQIEGKEVTRYFVYRAFRLPVFWGRAP